MISSVVLNILLAAGEVTSPITMTPGAAIPPSPTPEATENIPEQIGKAIKQDPFLGNDAERISVSLEKDLVVIRGQVHNEQAMKRVDSIVSKIVGATNYINQLIVRK